MSKIKPNNLVQAQKEWDAIEGKKKNELTTEINEVDKDLFSVGLVRVDVVNKKVTKSVNVQIFNKRAFEKIEKSFVYLGYDKIIVLHNPEKQIESSNANASEEKSIDEKTLNELKDFAKEKEIDITGLTKKEDVLEAIKKAIAPPN